MGKSSRASAQRTEAEDSDRLFSDDSDDVGPPPKSVAPAVRKGGGISKSRTFQTSRTSRTSRTEPAPRKAVEPEPESDEDDEMGTPDYETEGEGPDLAKLLQDIVQEQKRRDHERAKEAHKEAIQAKRQVERESIEQMDALVERAEAEIKALSEASQKKLAAEEKKLLKATMEYDQLADKLVADIARAIKQLKQDHRSLSDDASDFKGAGDRIVVAHIESLQKILKQAYEEMKDCINRPAPFGTILAEIARVTSTLERALPAA